MIRDFARKAFQVLFVAFLFLNSLLLNQAEAKDHFMEALGIFELDEKIEAPDFTLKDLNGKEVKLKDYRGKIVFLNFWATWCLPCRVEMPSMEKLYAQFKSRNFTILAINLRENSRTVKDFQKEFKLTFPILLDTDGSVGLEYAARAIPTTYLVDRKGYIIGAALGPRDWASKEAFELFNHLLDTATPS